MDDKSRDSYPVQDDPYGTTIKFLHEAIRAGLEYEGQMNDREHANLIAIEEFIRARDNA
jgi:hypothetical protein